MMQKRIAAIHDLSCFGKCSLTVALPVISCFGIECAVVPTAMLSGHFAALPQVQVWDQSEHMAVLADHWEQGGLTFDGIFTGYLGTAEQVIRTEDFVRRFKGADTLFVADPAMADRGKLYRGFEASHAADMARLCSKADVTLPNVTEACLMLGEPYRENHDRDFVEKLLRGMTRLGAKKAVITGVSLSPDEVGIACLDGEDAVFFSRPRTAGHFNGTGDLFASVFTAAMVKGRELLSAAETAMDFTARVIAETAKNPHHRVYGVDFELHLQDLPL